MRKSFSDFKFLLQRYYHAAFNCGEIAALTAADCLDDYDIDESFDECELRAGSIGNEILAAIKALHDETT